MTLQTCRGVYRNVIGGTLRNAADITESVDCLHVAAPIDAHDWSTTTTTVTSVTTSTAS
jgi:hypothetical protein